MADIVVHTNSASDVLLWIDGDSCPKNLRAILLRAVVRTGIRATFVADRTLPDVLQSMADHTAALRRQVKKLALSSGSVLSDGFSVSCIPTSNMEAGSEEHSGIVSSIDNIRKVRTPIAMIVVDTGADSADDYIVEHAAPRTLAVTHDVPLAARLVSKGLVVLDDRGGCFTPANMGERLSLRNAMTEFREMGIYAEQGRGIGAVETKAFADTLDKQLMELLRRFPDGRIALHPEQMLFY